MKIVIYYIGRDKKNHFTDIEELFLKRLQHYVKVEVKPIKPKKLPKTLAVSEIRKAEAQLLSDHIKKESRVILLDEGGKHHDSVQFSKYLEAKLSGGGNSIALVIGGAYGFSEAFKKQHNNLISLSKMTFAHHLARVVLLEQLYRAFTIINNEPYHNS